MTTIPPNTPVESKKASAVAIRRPSPALEPMYSATTAPAKANPALVRRLATIAGFAYAGAVVAEYIGSNAGLGRRIATAEAFFDSTGVFGGIVLIAALALLLDAGLQLAEGAFSRWKPRREH